MAKMPAVERALTRLQKLLRRPPSTDPTAGVWSRIVPDDLSADETRTVSLLSDEYRLFVDVQHLLVADRRFEHLQRKVEDVLWHFVCRCFFDRSQDFVPLFVDEHAREPEERVCFIPIESLGVKSETQFFGLRLLPLDHPELPEAAGPFQLAPPVASVVAIDTYGTHLGRMAERAQQEARHALSVLRLALREHREIADEQLRFTLAHVYSFGGPAIGWQLPPGAAFPLELDDSLVSLADSQAISALATAPSTELERRGRLALAWLERAALAGEPLIALLYRFFALESFLGDKAEGLKAHSLAFRRAVLSRITRGGFTHPNRIFLLYDQVRPAAVHGSEPPVVSERDMNGFAWDVRRALNEYLEFGRSYGFTRRSQLLQGLEGHEDRLKLISWLRKAGGPGWTDYLDKLEERRPARTEGDASAPGGEGE